MGEPSTSPSVNFLIFLTNCECGAFEVAVLPARGTWQVGSAGRRGSRFLGEGRPAMPFRMYGGRCDKEPESGPPHEHAFSLLNGASPRSATAEIIFISGAFVLTE